MQGKALKTLKNGCLSHCIHYLVCRLSLGILSIVIAQLRGSGSFRGFKASGIPCYSQSEGSVEVFNSFVNSLSQVPICSWLFVIYLSSVKRSALGTLENKAETLKLPNDELYQNK